MVHMAAIRMSSELGVALLLAIVLMVAVRMSPIMGVTVTLAMVLIVTLGKFSKHWPWYSWWQ